MADHYPTDRKTKWIVCGTSMYPVLRNGDVIQMALTPFTSLRTGDIVLLETATPTGFVVHRLIGWRYKSGERCGVLKGDNALKQDAFFLFPQNYLGRAYARQRRPGEMLPGEVKVFRRSFSAAIFSAFSMNVPGLRLAVRKILIKILALLNLETPGRFLLARTRCYIFHKGPALYQARLTLAGKPVAEVRLDGDGVMYANGQSFIGLMFSSEQILAHIHKRYPKLFPMNEVI